jgi:hypothetical protein
MVMKHTIFWDITPCSPLKFNRRFAETYLLGLWPAFTLVSCSAYSTLKMESICSSEISVDFLRTTRFISYTIVHFSSWIFTKFKIIWVKKYLGKKHVTYCTVGNQIQNTKTDSVPWVRKRQLYRPNPKHKLSELWINFYKLLNYILMLTVFFIVSLCSCGQRSYFNPEDRGKSTSETSININN